MRTLTAQEIGPKSEGASRPTSGGSRSHKRRGWTSRCPQHLRSRSLSRARPVRPALEPVHSAPSRLVASVAPMRSSAPNPPNHVLNQDENFPRDGPQSYPRRARIAASGRESSALRRLRLLLSSSPALLLLLRRPRLIRPPWPLGAMGRHRAHGRLLGCPTRPMRPPARSAASRGSHQTRNLETSRRPSGMVYDDLVSRRSHAWRQGRSARTLRRERECMQGQV